MGDMDKLYSLLTESKLQKNPEMKHDIYDNSVLRRVPKQFNGQCTAFQQMLLQKNTFVW